MENSVRKLIEKSQMYSDMLSILSLDESAILVTKFNTYMVLMSYLDKENCPKNLTWYWKDF